MVGTATYKNTRAERLKSKDQAESRFISYCRRKGLNFYRFGFYGNDREADGLWHVPKSLRALPDFLVIAKNKSAVYFCEVKGTVRIKYSDLSEYLAFEGRYCSDVCLFYIVFAMKNGIFFKSVNDVNSQAKSANRMTYDDSQEDFFIFKLRG